MSRKRNRHPYKLEDETMPSFAAHNTEEDAFVSQMHTHQQSFVYERDMRRVSAEDPVSFLAEPTVIFSQGNFDTTESMRRGAEIACGIMETRRYLDFRRRDFRSWKSRGRIFGQWDRKDHRREKSHGQEAEHQEQQAQNAE